MLHLLVYRRESHRYLHQETVELGLRQAVGALLLYRVLGGDDGIYVVHLVCVAVDGGLPFLHHLEEGSLRLCRRTVYLVGKHDVGEHRTGMEIEFRRLHAEYRCAEHVARHQVRRELYS